MLGRPVARCLVEKGHRVRVLARGVERARGMLGDSVEIVAGNAVDREDVRRAMANCDAVHINLLQDSELTAARGQVARGENGTGRKKMDVPFFGDADGVCDGVGKVAVEAHVLRGTAKIRIGGREIPIGQLVEGDDAFDRGEHAVDLIALLAG